MSTSKCEICKKYPAKYCVSSPIRNSPTGTPETCKKDIPAIIMTNTSEETPLEKVTGSQKKKLIHRLSPRRLIHIMDISPRNSQSKKKNVDSTITDLSLNSENSSSTMQQKLCFNCYNRFNK